MRGLLTRLVIPLAVVVVLPLLVQYLNMRARAQAERIKPRKATERPQPPQQQPAPPAIDRSLTRDGFTTLSDCGGGPVKP